jgi:uncharacterized protein
MLKKVVFISLFTAIFESSVAQNIAVNDEFLPAQSAKIKGHLGNVLDAAYQHRIIDQDVNHLVEPFKKRNETWRWQSEFWGKWFTSAILAYKYRPESSLENILKKAVDDLIATQTEEGYIGNYKTENRLEQWDIWGRKYVMLGLLDYYELKQDSKSLLAAQKVADHVIKEINAADGQIINKGNYRGMAASSILEPMVKLYRITKEKKYLDFAKEIVRQWETPNGPMLISKSGIEVSKRFPKTTKWYSWEQGQKAYEMMSCYEGLLELYRITGNNEYKKAVEATWQQIKDKEINVAGSGAAVEMWFGGKNLQTTSVKHFQETCVTVTWIKLNQQLLRLTGEAKYADEIEKSYYNALLAALSKDGKEWAKYTPLNGQRLKGSGQCGMNLNCCDASGSRGLFTLPLTAVMQAKNGISINFFVEGNYQLFSPKKQIVNITQKTFYPKDGAVLIALNFKEKEEMALKIRVPNWSKNTTISINREFIYGLKSGDYTEIKRVWSDKDEILMNLDMNGRIEKLNNHVAIMSGPIVLARDSMFEGVNLAMNFDPVLSADGRISLVPVSQPKGGVWIEYTAQFIPESYAEQEAKPIEIHLCDYASAGNIDNKSFFKVWLSSVFNPAKD